MLRNLQHTGRARLPAGLPPTVVQVQGELQRDGDGAAGVLLRVDAAAPGPEGPPRHRRAQRSEILGKSTRRRRAAHSLLRRSAAAGGRVQARYAVPHRLRTAPRRLVRQPQGAPAGVVRQAGEPRAEQAGAPAVARRGDERHQRRGVPAGLCGVSWQPRRHGLGCTRHGEHEQHVRRRGGPRDEHDEPQGLERRARV